MKIKKYILLFFGFASVAMHAGETEIMIDHATDIIEDTISANIPYYKSKDELIAKQPRGWITVKGTSTLTYQDIKNIAEKQVGPVLLRYTVGGLIMPVNLKNTLPIATIYSKTQKQLGTFIEQTFSLILTSQ